MMMMMMKMMMMMVMMIDVNDTTLTFLFQSHLGFYYPKVYFQ